MLFSSQIFAKASGSLNGMTFSHNKGGQYVRCRSLPTNPNSCRQQEVRSAFNSLVNSWTNTLSQAQRDAWETYADNVPVTNRIGNETTLSGQNWFVGNNVPRVSLGETPIITAPTTFSRGDPGQTSFNSATEGGSTVINITDSGDWAGTDNAKLFVYQSKPVNNSRNFIEPQYQWVGTVDGDSVSPPTTYTITGPELVWPNSTDQKYNLKMRSNLPDGRLSSELIQCVEEVSV